MPVYTLTAEFTDDERKVFNAMLRDLAVGFPDFHHGMTVNKKRIKTEELGSVPEEVRAFKAAALNKEPFTYPRVALALEAARQQYDACVEQSDPDYWRAQETPGVDPEVSARYGERRMGEVLAEARAEQTERATAAWRILHSAAGALLPHNEPPA